MAETKNGAPPKEEKGGGKVCRKCKKERDASYFDRHSRTFDGLVTICKPCQAARHGKRVRSE